MLGARFFSDARFFSEKAKDLFEVWGMSISQGNLIINGEISFLLRIILYSGRGVTGCHHYTTFLILPVLEGIEVPMH